MNKLKESNEPLSVLEFSPLLPVWGLLRGCARHALQLHQRRAQDGGRRGQRESDPLMSSGNTGDAHMKTSLPNMG